MKWEEVGRAKSTRGNVDPREVRIRIGVRKAPDAKPFLGVNLLRPRTDQRYDRLETRDTLI